MCLRECVFYPTRAYFSGICRFQKKSSEKCNACFANERFGAAGRTQLQPSRIESTRMAYKLPGFLCTDQSRWSDNTLSLKVSIVFEGREVLSNYRNTDSTLPRS